VSTPAAEGEGRRRFLLEEVLKAPDSPGVYLMKGVDGGILYVGKALRLRRRIASYFTDAPRSDSKTEALVRQIHTFEIILTGTEQEAFILEATLIKRHRPRYNVFQKDDKRYPSLRLDPSEPYPVLEVVRRIRKDGALYFGPFAASQPLRETLKFIHRTFKLRKCKSRPLKPRSRPCLSHQMGLCLGPCALDVPESTYQQTVEEVLLFLKGRTPRLISDMEGRMRAASERLEYEAAGVLRDKVSALKRTLEKQVSVCTDFKDRDVFASARRGESIVITRLNIRGGFLLGIQHFEFPQTLADDAEALSSLIRGYYEKGHFIPEEILAATPLEDADNISKMLTDAKRKRVRVRTPRRGEKARLTAMAERNAETRLEILIRDAAEETDRILRLQRKLGMQGPPRRIECFDTSATSGTEPVASLVVFENGSPKPSDYRRYRIRTVSGPDDYAFMEEALRRRFSGTAASGLPDLLMVDGGKGQLGIAAAVAGELGLHGAFQMIALAKKDREKGEAEDKVYVRHRADALAFGRETDLLRFLQRIRDEAHRFAVTFHRRRRRGRSLESALDGIPGIGEKRKRILLARFGGINQILNASPEAIAALPGLTLRMAHTVLEALNALPKDSSGKASP